MNISNNNNNNSNNKNHNNNNNNFMDLIYRWNLLRGGGGCGVGWRSRAYIIK